MFIPCENSGIFFGECLRNEDIMVQRKTCCHQRLDEITFGTEEEGPAHHCFPQIRKVASLQTPEDSMWRKHAESKSQWKVRQCGRQDFTSSGLPGVVAFYDSLGISSNPHEINGLWHAGQTWACTAPLQLSAHHNTASYPFKPANDECVYSLSLWWNTWQRHFSQLSQTHKSEDRE